MFIKRFQDFIQLLLKDREVSIAKPQGWPTKSKDSITAVGGAALEYKLYKICNDLNKIHRFFTSKLNNFQNTSTSMYVCMKIRKLSEQHQLLCQHLMNTIQEDYTKKRSKDQYQQPVLNKVVVCVRSSCRPYKKS